MAIWTNKNGANKTTWGASQTTKTSAWETRPEFEGEATQIGTISAEAGVTGTYASAAAASVALIGSRYRLFTDKPFYFGTDDEIHVQYDGVGFNINHTSPDSPGDSNEGQSLFSINRSGTPLFEVRNDTHGKTIVQALQFDGVSKGTPNSEGIICYDGGEFWYSIDT